MTPLSRMHEHRVLRIREAGYLYEAIVDDDLGLRRLLAMTLNSVPRTANRSGRALIRKG